MPATTTWNNPAKTFHWLVALMIFTAAALGILADNVEMSPGKLQLFVWHKSVGITVLGVMILRLIWKFVSFEPEEVSGLSATNIKLANLGHWLLYAVAILMPLSGWIVTSAANFPFKWFGLFEFPLPWATNEALQAQAEVAHGSLFLILIILILGHVVMAFKHQLAGVPLLQRMLPGKLGAAPTIGLVIVLAAAWVALAWTSSYQNVPASPSEPAVSQLANTSETEVIVQEVDASETDNWVMLVEESTLGFIGDYAGVEFNGGFASFSPQIAFDPDKLDQSVFDVLIDITSAFTESPDMDSSIPNADWFHFDVFPQSTYKATSFVTSETGYIAQGVLSLKGVSQPVDLDFQWLESESGQVNLVGEAQVNRLDFGVGSGYWAEDPTVGFEVKVVVDLLLEKQ